MLRITHIEGCQSGPTIKLEGKLLAPWTTEVRAACQAAAEGQPRPRLDLSAVTYVDADGMRLLEELAQGGMELANCSHFIATLLHREAKS
jgi:anti-anti-sigma regulatory factor